MRVVLGCGVDEMYSDPTQSVFLVGDAVRHIGRRDAQRHLHDWQIPLSVEPRHFDPQPFDDRVLSKDGFDATRQIIESP